MLKLNHTQNAALKRLAKSHSLSFLLVFGSVARGDALINSDLDIGYLSQKPFSLQQQYSVQQKLQNILNTKRAIDLVNLATATPLLSREALRDGQMLFAVPHAADQFYQRTVKRYIDTRPLFQATQEYVKTAVI